MISYKFCLSIFDSAATAAAVLLVGTLLQSPRANILAGEGGWNGRERVREVGNDRERERERRREGGNEREGKRGRERGNEREGGEKEGEKEGGRE